MTAEQTPPLPDDRRPQAPPNHQRTEGDGPPEGAGARYAEGEVLQSTAGQDGSTGRGRRGGGFGCGDGIPAASVLVGQRRHRQVTRKQRRRSHRVVVLLDDVEFEDVRQAARAAGMTEGGWAAEAALAAARSEAAPEAGLARQVLLELMASRTQVRRVGVNLNQAVAALNATGEPPAWLAHAAATARRVVVHLDETATAVASMGISGRHGR